MKNIFHRYLSLPFEINKPDLFSTSGDIDNYHFDMSSYTDQNMTEWLKSLGLEVSQCEAFCTLPGSPIPIHCDSATIDNHVKINLTWGDNDGKTIWWECSEVKNIDIEHNVMNNELSTIVVPEGLIADEKKCKIVYEANTNSPSLLNVGQMHSTHNPSKTQCRWTICFVPKHINSNCLYVYWNEALEIFKDYIVEEK